MSKKKGQNVMIAAVEPTPAPTPVAALVSTPVAEAVPAATALGATAGVGVAPGKRRRSGTATLFAGINYNQTASVARKTLLGE